jgi:hypothetical protein
MPTLFESLGNGKQKMERCYQFTLLHISLDVGRKMDHFPLGRNTVLIRSQLKIEKKDVF